MKAQEQLYALIEMSRLSRPIIIEQEPDTNGYPSKKICMHESIWTDSELKAIKKKMIECVNEMGDDNQSDNL